MTPNDIDKVVVTHKTKIQEGIEKRNPEQQDRHNKTMAAKEKSATTSLQSRDKRKVNNMEELPS